MIDPEKKPTHQHRLWARPALCLAALLTLGTLPLAALPRSPLEPAGALTVAQLDSALARLANHRRMLVIAAHPDDEDTRLLALVAKGEGGEAAYLSLSRGEGGQNLIGPELGVGLGLIRSQELLAARRIDGAQQFFSRAYDFGFTRSLKETFERWPKEVLLEDAVRVVRRFKPRVLVAVFPPSAQAGHGQHWASGVVAEEVVELAADPDTFPELGPPWQIEAFYRSAFFRPAQATLQVPLGILDPNTGRSIFQLSMQSRSQHRSQDMGLVQPLGDAMGRLTWVSGAGRDGDPEAGMWHGIDTSLVAMAASLPGGNSRQRVSERLEKVADLAAKARQQLTPADAGRAVQPLLDIIRELQAAQEELRETGAAGLHTRQLLDGKLLIAQEALASAAAVVVDAVTDRETVVPGGRLPVRTILWNAGPHPLTDLEVTLSRPGWQVAGEGDAPANRSFFAARATYDRQLQVTVPPDAAPSAPYFLRRPKNGDLYDWSAASAAERGRPFEEPSLSAIFSFRLAGTPVKLVREVVFRAADQAIGEIRRPLRVVPRLEVKAAPRLVVWPTARTGRPRLRVEVVSNAESAQAGQLQIQAADPWSSPAAIPFSIAEPRGRVTLEVELEVPGHLADGRYGVDVTAASGGERFTMAYPLVDYPHIRPTPRPTVARVEISAGDIRFPPLTHLGYVRGASDRVPEALHELGLPVRLLDATELADGDLSAYDAIVIGSRAYETDPALVRANERLLDYVRSGGLMIVQYQQYQFVRGEFAPWPLEIRRPHDRVTDETAPIRLLAPDHPAFRWPNPLRESDWQGWVQERGLYFAGTWDDAYQPLLTTADPGGDEKQGGLLVTRLGDGTYVYTGLAFFRQLPAGVPGAYRLFANLLGLGSSERIAEGS